MTWEDRAACTGMPTELFFESIWPEDSEGSQGFDTAVYERAKAICSSCPVRLECYRDEMDHEGPSAQAKRYGLRGGVTPQQRYSIWRRDAVTCERCSETYDPLGLVSGDVVCACGSFEEPEIPLEGDAWFPRHEGLLQRLVTYLLRETQPGDRILPPYKMLLELGHRRKDDLPLVYERLIADGLIVRGDGRGIYFRAAGRRALATWVPPSRRHKEAA